MRLLSDLKFQMKASAYVDNEHISVKPLSKWDDKIIEIIRSETSQINNDIAEKSASKATSKQALSKHFDQSAELERSMTSQPDFFNDTQNEGVVEINDMIATEAATKIDEHEYVENMVATANRNDSQAIEYLFQSLNIALSLEDKVLKLTYFDNFTLF
jgi:hypothetical protein